MQKQVAFLNADGIVEKEFFSKYASLPAWLEEILCDLLGLLIFGLVILALNVIYYLVWSRLAYI